MLMIPFWIGSALAFVFLLGAAGISFVSNRGERKKQKQLIKLYSEEAKLIEKEASLIYDEICLSNTKINFDSKIDIALFIALINHYDLKELTDVNHISIQDLLEVIDWAPKLENKEVNDFLAHTMQKRIKELFSAEYSTYLVPINFQTISTSLEMQSDTIKEVIRKAKEIEKRDNVSEKSTVFYDHNYPVDETVVVLQKKKPF